MYLKECSIISMDIGISSKDIIEYTLNLKREFLKKISFNITKEFNDFGFIVNDCTPWNEKFLSFGDCMIFKIKKANDSLSNLHISLEFNNKKDKGIKCFVDEEDFKEEKISKNVVTSFENLGFLNLGVRYSDVYIIRNTNMPSIVLKIDCDILELERDKDGLISSLSKNLVKSIISSGTI
ncbi:MAG: N-acetylmuramoyl-L-alanine amidase [Clostridium perfringens]|nr:N-acetylmuramoyl-L-alanine amidase [Clostridium perfringens]